MEIVIDISEEEYKTIREGVEASKKLGYSIPSAFEAVANGTPLPSKWIPTSERTPKKQGYYITSTIYNEVYCDYWSGDRFDRDEAVVAWMKLPPSYKPESGGEE